MRLILALILGLLPLGGYLGYQHYYGPPCDDRCGSETYCVEGLCLKAPNSKRRVKKKRRRSRRRRGKGRASASHGMEPSRRKATAQERRLQSKGPSLRQTDFVNMSDGDTQKELSEQTISAKVRRVDRKVVACIDQARGEEVDLDSGVVTLSFRIERSGRIKKVKVRAPSLLIKGGIYPCIRDVILALRFPPSGGSNIMTYPYRLR